MTVAAAIRRARALDASKRLWILAALGALVVLALSLAPRVAQPPGYHGFADTRVILGVARFGDVVSNLGFLVAGLAGSAFVFAARAKRLFEGVWERLPWQVFFLGLILVAIGSAYYHGEPTTARLYWDRAAMAIAFMGLFTGIVMDRTGIGVVPWLLPAALVFGIGCTTIWSLTERAGVGDLRIYFAVQILPVAIMLAVLLLFPARRPQGRPLALCAGLYALAVLAENLDHQIYRLLAEAISGHAIKHLLAAAAGAMIAVMLAGRGAPGGRSRAS